jgi:hypothetical protein
MDFEKLLKNHYVRLALLALLAYFAYHYFIGVKEGNGNWTTGGYQHRLVTPTLVGMRPMRPHKDSQKRL